MDTIPVTEVVQELEVRLARLSEAETQLADLTSDFTKKTQALVTEFSPESDRLTLLRDETVTEIAEIFQANRDLLTPAGSKTVTLRGGTISARLGSEGIEIVDQERLEKFLRRRGRWVAFTTQPKRQIDKAALKKDRALVNSASDQIIRFRRNENLIIKLPKVQLEIKRVLHPLRRSLGKS